VTAFRTVTNTKVGLLPHRGFQATSIWIHERLFFFLTPVSWIFNFFFSQQLFGNAFITAPRFDVESNVETIFLSIEQQYYWTSKCFTVGRYPWMVLPSVNILTFKNKILNVGGFKLLVIKLNENYILNYPLNYILN
jgi:hypothetical protein